MNFPLIYCNGCSYSDPDYRSPLLKDKTYSHYLGKLLNGFTINNAKAGSCNRRILRSSTHDLLVERKHNPDQQIIALIQLTFEIRDELWIDSISNEGDEKNAVESNFVTHQFSGVENWKELLLSGSDIVGIQQDKVYNEKFLKKWSEGRAFFYSSYAERINLLLDILFFTTLLKTHNIDYLIFAGPMFDKLEEEYLIDFFKSELHDPRIFDLEKFGFCEWCDEKKFEPIDKQEPRNIGHYQADAHEAFAKQILLPKLKELNIIT